jgi:hypothetical protein
VSGLKIAGGILALVGAALILIVLIINIPVLSSPVFQEAQISWVLNLLVVILAIPGGIIGFTGRRSGGAIALVGPALFIMFSMIYNWITYSSIPTYSFIEMFIYIFGPYSQFSVEILMILAGSVMILGSGREYPKY